MLENSTTASNVVLTKSQKDVFAPLNCFQLIIIVDNLLQGFVLLNRRVTSCFHCLHGL